MGRRLTQSILLHYIVDFGLGSSIEAQLYWMNPFNSDLSLIAEIFLFLLELGNLGTWNLEWERERCSSVNLPVGACGRNGKSKSHPVEQIWIYEFSLMKRNFGNYRN